MPDRPVVLCFTADEEAGGSYGAGWLVDNHPDLFEGVSEAIGEVEVERMRETHYDGSRAGRNFALDRQTEPLVLPSEVSGLDDLRGFLKYGNHVARFSFPFIALEEKSPAFDERKMEDLILPSAPPAPEPAAIDGNLFSNEYEVRPSCHEME